LLGELKRAPIPILTFALEGSAGERRLLSAYEKAKFTIRELGAYPSYGFMERGASAAAECFIETVSSDELPPAIIDFGDESKLMWNCFEPEQIAHYRRDSRPRRLVLIRSSNGGPVGAAWIVRSEFITPQGVQQITTIDSVYFPQVRQQSLVSLFNFAARFGRGTTPERSSPELVVAANLLGVDHSILTATGVRRLPTTYCAYLCSAEVNKVFCTAEGTNLEIL